MISSTNNFDFRPVISQSGESCFTVVPQRVRFKSGLSAKKKVDGYWDVWFDMATVNNSPIVARLGTREAMVSDAVGIFAQIVPLPTANRYIIHDVIDSSEDIETACTVLLSLETLLRQRPPRTRTTERIEGADAERMRKSRGVCFETSRSRDQQLRVAAAFEKLASAGYSAYEIGPTEFAISRMIVSGGSSFQGKEVSIEALESAANRVDQRKSGWRSWL